MAFKVEIRQIMNSRTNFVHDKISNRALLIAMFFFLCFIGVSLSLTCNQGTNNEMTTVTCPNVEDSCISAFLSTGGFPQWNISSVEGMGTPVYSCGNCSFYQIDLNNTPLHSVSCCNSDLCNTMNGPVASPGSCDSLTTYDNCIANPGKYYSEEEFYE